MPYQTVTIATMDSLVFDRRTWPAAVRDAWLASDGWPLRRLRMGEGSRGALLFLGGRGDMHEKYLEAMVHWAGLGWSVTSFDWRGQGGSGRLCADIGVGHCADFGIWVRDLQAFFADWRSGTNGPHVVVAHSMGGHLLLRAMVEGLVAPDASVLVAPMLGLNGGPIPSWLGLGLAQFMARIGDPARRAWKQSERPLDPANMRQALLTHSADRYADELWWRAQTPEIGVGPPSWAWVAEAYRSTRALERSEGIGEMRIPTLILAAQRDRLVSPTAIRRIAARLPDAVLHEYGPESAHEILREADGVRLDALARIDAFFDRRAP